MTIDEAKANLKYAIRYKDRPLDESMRMAIKSLEAWEKVKEEIKDLDLGFVDEEYRAGVAYGIMKITKIINKRLAEVSE